MAGGGLKSPEAFRAMLAAEATVSGLDEIAGGLALLPGPIAVDYWQALALRRAELVRASAGRGRG